MSMILFRCRGAKWIRPQSTVCSKRLSSVAVPANQPQYPPIVEETPLAQKLRRKKQWHDWLRSHDTIEEKLFELNMPKYYGWNSVILRDDAVPYNFLPWARFSTRTHIEVSDAINPLYSDSLLDTKASEIASELKSEVENVILFEWVEMRRRQDLDLYKERALSDFESSDLRTRSFVKHLNQVLMAGMVDQAKYLNMVTAIPDPRIDAFWFLGGINPSKEKIEERKRRTKMTNINVKKSFLDPSLVDLPVNEPIQFYGKPILQLQTRYPLPPVEDLKENDSRAAGVPHVPYEPTLIYLEKQYRRATTVPGFWPGEQHSFGMMSFHSSSFLDSRPFGPEDNLEAAHCTAILTSFSWLLGQACYQGFSTFHDVTYPLVTQTAMTNGKDWSFYLYQLNTTLLHTMNSTENPRCNVCWASNPMKLFEDVQDGRVIGFNENVLKQIIKMYLIEPKEREGVEMRPYLSDKPYVADIEYEERRDWLERQFKHITSNRPRKQEKPEVYAWEKIFRIRFNDLPQLNNRKWYMSQQPPPDCRRYDDHPPVYKPNALRTEEDQKYCHRIRRVYRMFYPGTNKEKIKPPGT
ncbi:28S ribosomal protein S30, mitochondrial [Frankliniella fusca]|uniref:28S ribosomal protein S30, mitochondrial n=1 Tax=Frankliniella fusca TaxID=407009 RepID=A0AAE1HI99_9NEOP|nr:28S ribosomal protein S30, mitochondrial [Frankliniella fusca]